ncbi:MAG: class I SAM-dependent methyltransferase family protein [Crenarchaeota archaeon]|nr:class I SAM-dependent methyltransferase family protein [Thermoproteota archaeon]
MPKEKAQEMLNMLKKKKLIDTRYKVVREGDLVYIPVKEVVDDLKVVERELPPREVREDLRTCLERRLGRGDWPRSFSIIGDIAIISINDEILLKYADHIAECIMKSQKNVKSVWGKLGTEGPHRTAKLVHLGGERRSETLYKEHGLLFKVDVARVYVNPSLANEHSSVASLIREGEEVLDMFAGVGFFAIHIASRKRTKVVAVDINPNAVRLMIDNLTLNKLKGEVIPVLGDAGEVAKFFKDKSFDVIIMNLPHSAVKFLDEARRLARRMIVLYAVGTEEEIKEKFGKYKYTKVIDYAPYKGIWRIEIPSK